MRLIPILLLLSVSTAPAADPTTAPAARIVQTGRDMDIAIGGNGCFAERLPDSLGGGIVYTRFGNLFVNNSGELVVDDDDGLKLVPTVAFPKGSDKVKITEDGAVTTGRSGSSAMVTIGRIYVTTFEHPKALCIYPPTRHSFYAPPSAGKATQSIPGENGAGKLLLRHLEPHDPEPGRVRLLTRLVETDRDLDVAIEGRGFFPLRVPSPDGGYTGYTRSGDFTINKLGQLCEQDLGGAVIAPPITFPSGMTDVQITSDGVVTATVPPSIAPQRIGQIQVYRFTNPNELGRAPANRDIRLATDGAGPAVLNNPAGSDADTLLQGYLEEPIDAN